MTALWEELLKMTYVRFCKNFVKMKQYGNFWFSGKGTHPLRAINWFSITLDDIDLLNAIDKMWSRYITDEL